MSPGAGQAGTTSVPELPGVLSAEAVLRSGRHLARVQRADGMIPWYPGGHCDPWNHVEAAMALTACGMGAEAERAYRWLAGRQLPEGAWFNYYRGGSVEDPRLDTNVCAYLATGLWHHCLVTDDPTLLAQLWPAVERAVGFVLRWQRPDGSVAWSLDQAGRPEGYALLTGSSSIYHSLRCATAAAARLDLVRPEWELAAGRLRHAITSHPGAFAPKDEFAMDWYYPVLTGALDGPAAVQRLVGPSWSRFVLPDRGVRCVSTGDWVTAAETAECALAFDAVGRPDEALTLLETTSALRLEDGSYWTGMVFPGGATFPVRERTTYTAAAVVLAADALSGATGGAGLFHGTDLPGGLDLAEPDCPGGDGSGCQGAAALR
ncbi:MAG TPA: hypothetical protein VGL60_00095 [Acidimicrobiales bacterium]|jgi:hypothetical protein